MAAQDENDGDILLACPRAALLFDLARALPDAVVVALDEARERSLAPSSGSAGTIAVDTDTPPSQRESSSLAMVMDRPFKA